MGPRLSGTATPSAQPARPGPLPRRRVRRPAARSPLAVAASTTCPIATSAATAADAVVPAADVHGAAAHACDRRCCRSILSLGARGSSPRCVLKGSLPRRGAAPFPSAQRQAQDYAPFAYILTALLFARSGLYADRASRPGALAPSSGRCSRVTVVALLTRRSNGEHFSSYYLFWGSLVLASRSSTCRCSAPGLRPGEPRTLLRAAGYHRRAVLVGRRAGTSSAVAHALDVTPGAARRSRSWDTWPRATCR